MVQKSVPLAVIFTICFVSLASARWLRPWERHIRHHVEHHGPLADCDKINAAVKAMTPDRYERALRSATKVEQEAITNCEAPR